MDANDARGASREHVSTLYEVGAALKRQFRFLALCFAALATGVIIAVLSARPLYEGTLKILVKRDRADSVISAGPQSTGRDERELTEAEMMSQVELLRSEELLRRVATETGLTRRLHAQYPSYGLAEAEEAAAKKLRRRLTVAPLKRTWLIDVGYEADDRAATHQVLDTLVRLYLEKHLSLRRPPGTYYFFAEQADRARQELEAARARLVAFGERHQVASAEIEKHAVLERLSEFAALRAQASAQLAETTNRLTAVSLQLASVPEKRVASVRSDAGLLNDVRTRIVSLELRRAELLEKFTPEYRGVREVEAQLEQARVTLASAEETPVREETLADNPTRQWLDTEAARARAEEAALHARVEALAATAGEYRATAQLLDLRDGEQQDLERDLKVAETNYLLYAQKQEEARISDELDRTRIANVAVAEGPVVAVTPHRNPRLAFLPLLLFVALLISGAMALCADALAPACRRWRAEIGAAPRGIGPVAPTEEPLA